MNESVYLNSSLLKYNFNKVKRVNKKEEKELKK